MTRLSPSHPLWRLVLALPPHLLILLLSAALVLFFSATSSLFLLFLTFYSHRLRAKNPARRRWLLSSLGITERAGEQRKKVVGFFHPYWFVPSLVFLLSRGLMRVVVVMLEEVERGYYGLQ